MSICIDNPKAKLERIRRALREAPLPVIRRLGRDDFITEIPLSKPARRHRQLRD